MTTIQIAYEVSDAALARVQSLLDDVADRDPNWNGADFIIKRDDFTCIPSARDEYAATALLHQIFAAIEGRDE